MSAKDHVDTFGVVAASVVAIAGIAALSKRSRSRSEELESQKKSLEESLGLLRRETDEYLKTKIRRGEELYQDLKASPIKAYGKAVMDYAAPRGSLIRSLASRSRSEEVITPKEEPVVKAIAVQEAIKSGEPEEHLKFIEKDFEAYKSEMRELLKEFKEHPIKSAGKMALSATSPVASNFTLEDKASLFMAFRTAGKEGLVAEFMRITFKKPRLRVLNVVPVPNPVRYVTLDKREMKGPTIGQMEDISHASMQDVEAQGKGWFSSFFGKKGES